MIVTTLALACALASAQTNTTNQAPSETEANPSLTEKTTKKRPGLFGLNYDVYFFGPGFGQPIEKPQGNLGKPEDVGLNSWNLVSLKARLSERIGIDLQLRSQIVYTSQPQFRWQGQRVGISGLLLSGEGWSLSGAVNSDMPIPGLLGQANEERTLLFNPGLFSFLSVTPKGSRWSLLMPLFPRFFFYRDGDARSVQDTSAGLAPGEKLQFVVQANPLFNYQVNDKLQARMGMTIGFRKNVAWDALQRDFLPLELGVNYQINRAISVYPYLQVSGPWDDALRAQLGSGANWAHTARLGMWLRGEVL